MFTSAYAVIKRGTDVDKAGILRRFFAQRRDFTSRQRLSASVHFMSLTVGAVLRHQGCEWNLIQSHIDTITLKRDAWMADELFHLSSVIRAETAGSANVGFYIALFLEKLRSEPDDAFRYFLLSCRLTSKTRLTELSHCVEVANPVSVVFCKSHDAHMFAHVSCTRDTHSGEARLRRSAHCIL